MSERLSDEVVAAMSQMPAAACHEQRMSPWDALSALTAEVLDWRNQRCGMCKHWDTGGFVDGWGRCRVRHDTYTDDDGCRSDWEPLP